MKRNKLIKSITLLAVLIAIVIIFAFGAIPTPALTITLIGIPIAIGASLFGPWVGLILGFTWGTVSLIQGVTGYDASGPILLEYNPFGLVVTCYIPRMIDGFLVGLIFKYTKNIDKNSVVGAIISALLVVILNTTLFLSCYVGYFISNETVHAFLESVASKYNFDPNNIFLFLIFGFGLNAIVELAVNLVVDVPSIIFLKKYTDRNQIEVSFSNK